MDPMSAVDLDAATILYFAAGLLGAMMRALWRGTEQQLRRTIAEVFSGGVGGIVLPYLGGWLPLDQELVAKAPVILKAALVYGATFSGVMAFHMFQERRRNGRTRDNGP